MSPRKLSVFSIATIIFTKLFLATSPTWAASYSTELNEVALKQRLEYRAMIPRNGVPESVAKINTFAIPAYNPLRNVPVRVYTPLGNSPEKKAPILIFVHGGGFISGDLDTHDVLARAIANRVGGILVSVDYRLAPENPFPSALEDVFSALKWVAANADKVDGDPERIAVIGDSAGGNLAAAVAMVSRDRSGPAIVAQWLMYPTLSNRLDTPSWRELGGQYFPTLPFMKQVLAMYVQNGVDINAPLVSPIEGNHEKLPPALIQVGELDPLRDESLDYAAQLIKSGIEAKAIVYPKSHHGFIQFFNDSRTEPQGEPALNEGVRFLREKLLP